MNFTILTKITPSLFTFIRTLTNEAQSFTPSYNYEMYKKLASKYNNAVNFVTLGLHTKWRRELVRQVIPFNGSKVIDAAGGTGLITLHLLKYYQQRNINNFEITLCDTNPMMMRVGMDKCKEMGVDINMIKWLECDIEKMLLKEAEYDAYFMCFGLRLGLNMDKTFEEAYRVLKPDSKIAILDFCYSKKPTLTQRLYVNYYIPKIHSRIIEWKWNIGDSAQFLSTNILAMPPKEEIVAKLEKAGFRDVTFKLHSGGIAVMYVGSKSLK